MADAVSEQQSLPMREEEALVIARRKAAEKVPRHRFGLAYLLLAALLGAGVGLFVVFVSGNGKSGGQEWSAWKPTQSGVQRFDQIAKNVGHEYALPTGRQLVGVLSTPPVVQGQSTPVPLRAIAVQTGLAGETSNDASFYGAGDAWAYVLCGFGTNCAISGASRRWSATTCSGGRHSSSRSTRSSTTIRSSPCSRTCRRRRQRTRAARRPRR